MIDSESLAFRYAVTALMAFILYLIGLCFFIWNQVTYEISGAVAAFGIVPFLLLLDAMFQLGGQWR